MSQLLDRPTVTTDPVGIRHAAPPPSGLVVTLARVALVAVRVLRSLGRFLATLADRTLGRRTAPVRVASSGGASAVGARMAPGASGPRRRRRRRVPLLLRLVATLLVALAVFVGVTLGPALAAPGSDSTAARVAEWAREWGMGDLVTWAEQVQYQAAKPAEGGSLTGGIPVAGSLDRALTPIPSRVNPALPGEGQWQDLLKNSSGQTVARVAFLRPDATHTAFSVGVVQMDANALKFVLHQGTHVPGGQIVASTSLTASEKKTVLATFNSGFQMKDANGGYWQNGTTIQPLVTRAASMVFGKDGTLKVESWPGGTPGSDVAAVRQNLSLLVDQGRVSPQVDAPDSTAVWGKTVGNKAYVWRTAVGVRSDGSVIFIVGPALNVATLASLAKDAGAVEAMELDINTDWTNYITYNHSSGTAVVPHKLTPDEFPNAARYLTASTRDFVAVLPR